MKHKQLLPIAVLCECFSYKDGYLFWKERPVSHFNSERAQKISNTRHSVGSPAYFDVNKNDPLFNAYLDQVRARIRK